MFQVNVAIGFSGNPEIFWWGHWIVVLIWRTLFAVEQCLICSAFFMGANRIILFQEVFLLGIVQKGVNHSMCM